MNEVYDLSKFMQPGAGQVDILQTLFNFAICMVMAFILRKFYINRSYSLSGKLHIGSILPILSAVVFTVIIVVKSSLALSLGLVGALSIVRFRTPIKEPEELVYLFLAIAIGLGYGAGYTLITTLLVSLILIIIYVWLSNTKYANTNEYNLVVNWDNSKVTFEQISSKVSSYVDSMSLVRLEKGSNGNSAVLMVSPNQDTKLDSIVDDLQKLDSKLHISFFEAKTNW